MYGMQLQRYHGTSSGGIHDATTLWCKVIKEYRVHHPPQNDQILQAEMRKGRPSASSVSSGHSPQILACIAGTPATEVVQWQQWDD